MNQQSFIANITKRLGRPMPEQPPEHPYRGAPPFWREQTLARGADRDQIIAQFIEYWQDAGGDAHHFASLSEVRSYIVQTAAELKAKRLIRHRHPLLDQMSLEELEAELPGADMTVWDGERPQEMKNRAADADIGLIVADYAVGATGTIVTMSSTGQGRSVSLLPTAVMAIVPTSRMRASLGEVMSDISAFGIERIPAGIHFISGPSRSADIENDLTIGVHGPGIVHALLYDG